MWILGYLKKGVQTPMAQGRSTEIVSMIKWIRTSRLSKKNSLSLAAVSRSDSDACIGRNDRCAAQRLGCVPCYRLGEAQIAHCPGTERRHVLGLSTLPAGNPGGKSLFNLPRMLPLLGSICMGVE